MPSGEPQDTGSPHSVAAPTGIDEREVPASIDVLTGLADNAANLRLLLEQLKTRVGVVPFVGAGMSVPLGFPAWRAFLESQAPDVATRQRVGEFLDAGRYEEAAEALMGARGENAFQSTLEDTFGAHRLPTPLPVAAILQLPRLCCGPVLTTNFDPVLEKVFENTPQRFEECILGMKIDTLREAFHRSRRVLVKLHGDAADRTDRVLTWSDYQRAYGEREPLTAFLRFAMTRPLLFLGCSLGEDRTVRVLEALAAELHGQHATGLQVHYAIVERPSGAADFKARHRRLSDLGIRPIWYPTGRHDLIEDLLGYLVAQAVAAGRTTVGGLHLVPELPPHFRQRPTLAQALKTKLLSNEISRVAVTGHGQAVGVQGMGGIGKSVLAATLARDAEVRAAFPDGVVWLSVGQQPNLVAIQGELLKALTGKVPAAATVQECAEMVREALQGRRVLVILDDVWEAEHAALFRGIPQGCRLLVTTRNTEVLIGLEATEQRVDPLTPEESLELLADWSGTTVEALPAQAPRIVDECGRLPLALAAVGAMVRLGPTAWKDALTRLRRADLDKIRKAFPDQPHPHLLRALEVSVEALPGEERERYLDLAVFPEDLAIPEGPLKALWGLDDLDVRDTLRRLAARSLGTLAEPADGPMTLLLHDLQRDLIRKRRQEQLPRLHQRLVGGWGDLHRLPDAYAWRWVAYHLVQGGQTPRLRELLLNFDWLQAKLEATDPLALVGDFGQAPSDEELSLVQAAIRLSAHVLSSDKHQLAGQLIGRLFNETELGVRALLEQASRWRGAIWLKPLNGSLHPPGTPLLRTLTGHSLWVTAVAMSPDGRLVVSASRDKTLKVWELSSGRELRTLTGHSGPVDAVAVSPDGRLAVSGSWDKTLKVWELGSGRELRTLTGHGGSVTGVAVSPDGRLAVSASGDKTLKVWELETGRELRTLTGHTGIVSAVAVNPGGPLVVSAAMDWTLKVWELETGRELRTLPGHNGPLCAVVVSPDGRLAVSGSDDKTLKVWELETGRELRTLAGHGEGVIAIAISPDGRLVVSASRDGALKVWELSNGRELRTLAGHSESVCALAVSPSDQVLVSGSRDQTLKVWELASGRELRAPTGHTSLVDAVAVSPDGRLAVSASKDKTLKVWDMSTGRELGALRGHGYWVTAVAVSPDGRLAVSASDDRTLKVWDLESGQELRTLTGHRDPATAVAVSPDGRLVVSASWDRTLKVWDLESGQELRTLAGHRDRVFAMAVSPDGRLVVSGSWDRTLKVWELETGRELRTLMGHTDFVYAVAVSPDGRLVVSASLDRTLKVWELETGRELRTLMGHTDVVHAVVVSPDGRLAVSGSSDRTLKVWDVASGFELRTLAGHSNGVNAVALSPDGRLAVSASRDSTLRVWDVQTAECLATFLGETWLLCCALTPDGRTIVAGEASGRVHFLRLVLPDDPVEEADSAKRRPPAARSTAKPKHPRSPIRPAAKAKPHRPKPHSR